MDQLLNFNTLIEILLGVSLSAASGFRVFVPLLTLSAAAVLGHANLPTDFDWIESPQALANCGAFSLVSGCRKALQKICLN